MKRTAMSTIRCSISVITMSFFLFATIAHGLVYDTSRFNRSTFPLDFVFGAASSAYQFEGAAFEGGKGPSIWDNFTHKFPGKISDGSSGDVATDFYNRYKEDVKLMKFIGLDVFRMSISWPRLLPRGKLSGGVNKEGIAFYNNVFNELLANGITPFVTLFHWDLPQALEDEYRGFLSPLIIDDFRDFANLCFKEFGDRVKHWITVNEPFIFVNGGYDEGLAGTLAPGRCSPWANCPQGNSATEPYVAAHHLLLCHAETVKLYKEKYQATQKGEIGIILVSHWMVPYSSSNIDKKAAKRALDFMFGWFAHPVVYGDYPKSMKFLVNNRLPKFTKEQSEMLRGSFDFLGLNYYTGNYAADVSAPDGHVCSTTDNMVHLTTRDIDGVLIGDPTGVDIFYTYPKGLRELLLYTKEKYNNPSIYITETGIGDFNDGTIKNVIEDPQRIDFYNRHLQAVREAIWQGVNVKGFIAWALTDNFEWASGYTIRFGLCYVDYKNGLKRIPKQSAIWFKNCLYKDDTDISHVEPSGGAAFEGGRGPSIWDNFTHKFPGKISDGSNGDVAIDFYNSYKEDVALMKFIGLDVFRMSISWPRILPRGKLSGGVNKEGIAFYNNVFNELLANGITPFVTLFHWDVPQALEDEYQGFLNPLIIDDFRDFANICFKEFGDRVKHWITLNEPYIFITSGYDLGIAGMFAPGRCSSRANCSQGNSATEPYVAGHHMLLSHATVVKLYKEKYQATQKGEIGITLLSHWMVPYSRSKLDKRAAKQALDFMLGWFAHPIVYGDYPKIMRSLVKNRLPKFTKGQSEMLKESFNFLGLNYYTANYAADVSSRNGHVSSTTDNKVHLTTRDKHGVLNGNPTGVSAFYTYPKGLRELLLYIKEEYNNPSIYITKNGTGDFNNGTVKNGIEDPQRIDFCNRHLQAVQEAIQKGVKVKGFIAWAFIDDFEWSLGYTTSFGLCYVDYKNGLKRIPKHSAIWFKNCLSKN